MVEPFPGMTRSGKRLPCGRLRRPFTQAAPVLQPVAAWPLLTFPQPPLPLHVPVLHVASAHSLLGIDTRPDVPASAVPRPMSGIEARHAGSRAGALTAHAISAVAGHAFIPGSAAGSQLLQAVVAGRVHPLAVSAAHLGRRACALAAAGDALAAALAVATTDEHAGLGCHPAARRTAGLNRVAHALLAAR